MRYEKKISGKNLIKWGISVIIVSIMANIKYTIYTEEEIDKFREEYVSTSITLKDLINKYNLNTPVIKSFSWLKTKSPKTDLPQDRVDEIVGYYITHDVTHKEMMKLFDLTVYQCNTFLSHKKGRSKPKKYSKYSDEYWGEVIIPEYMKDGVNYIKINEMFDVGPTDMNKRLKGLKEMIQPKVGDTNNRLTIVDINVPSVLMGTQLRRMVRVRCECGSEIDLNYNAFKTGKTKSCGCLLKKSFGNAFYSKGNTTEGRKTYTTYTSMKSRCLNPNRHNYGDYGGRGIKICDRWLDPEDGYKNFLDDMGYRPEGMTLDRIDVNGNYEPSNCRWSTNSLQMSNQRRFSHIKRHTDEEWVDIQKDYVENNLSYDSICEKYSVSTNECIKRFGGIKKLEKKKLWETINEYYKENKVTYRELSEMFGVNLAECVRYVIKD